MIKIEKRDLLFVKEGIIGHGCNCLGIMGGGVEKQVRDRWPHVFCDYKRFCFENSDKGENIEKLIGLVQILPINSTLEIANMFTQGYIGNTPGVKYASIEAIIQAMTTLTEYAATHDRPIFIPRIGALRGGLDWETEILPALMQFDNFDITICEL